MSWGRVRTGAAGLGMAVLLVALPLAFSKQVYAIVFTPKVVLLYLGMTALLVALSAAALERGGIQLRLSVVELLALALLGWGLLSALFAVSRVTGFFGLLNWGTGWLFWLACLGIWATVRRLDFSQRSRVAALWTGFVVASLMGLLALLQVIGVQSVVSWLPGMVAGRPGATIGNPIYFGTYMALLLLVGPRADACAPVTSFRLSRATAGLVLVTIGLVANLSRGPWLGAAAGVVVWAGHGRATGEMSGAPCRPLGGGRRRCGASRLATAPPGRRGAERRRAGGGEHGRRVAHRRTEHHRHPDRVVEGRGGGDARAAAARVGAGQLRDRRAGNT